MPPQNNEVGQNSIPVQPIAPFDPVSVAPSGTPPPPPAPGNKILNFINGKSKILIGLGIVLLVVILISVLIRVFSKTKTGSSEITWWGLWEDPSIVQPLITAYETDHPGVKINYIKQSPQDYRERLTNSLAKGTGPDIFAFHNTWVPMFRNDLDVVPVAVINPADFAQPPPRPYS